MISDHFLKIFEDFSKVVQGHTNVPEHFPKMSEDNQRFPKIEEDFWRRSEVALIIQQQI